jgi:hypothetical protein
MVTGKRIGKHRVLQAKSPVVANAFAALLIDLEKRTGKVPHAYFKWHEGNPIVNLFAFLYLEKGMPLLSLTRYYAAPLKMRSVVQWFT